MSNSSIRTIREDAKQLFNEARPWIKTVARLGYAAKGVVYVLIGTMAMLVAEGRKEQPADFSGVLIQVVRQPFGSLLLALLTIGLACYGLWCLVQAVLDTEKKGTSFFAITTRLLYTGVGFVYLAVAWSACRLLTGTGSVRPGDRPEQQWTATFLALRPYGQWLVVLIGIGFIGSSFHEFHRAYIGGSQVLKTEGTTRKAEDFLAMRIAQIGITARAVVFSIIGFFLIRSAVDYDPNKVHGISGTLAALRQPPYGPWALVTIAMGLIAYGGYMLFLSFRRRIDPV